MGFKIKDELCTAIQELKLAPQIKCEIFFVIIMFFVNLFIFITLGKVVVSYSIYKDIENTIDIHEFNQLAFLDIYIENSQLQLQEAFKDEARLLSNYYYNILTNNNIKIEEKNTCTNESIKICGDNLNLSDSMENVINKVFNRKIFSDKLENYIADIIIYDRSAKCIKLFQENSDKININKNLKCSDIENYICTKSFESIESIFGLKTIFPNNADDFKNVFHLPIYDEDVRHFPQFFEGTDYPLQIISFAFVPISNLTSIQQGDAFISTISKIIFVCGRKSSTDIIIKDIVQNSPGISILKVRHTFPYDLYNQKDCKLLRNLSLNDEESANIEDDYDTKEPKYLYGCFNSKKPISKYKKKRKYSKKSELDNFIETIGLFKYDTNIIGTNAANIIKATEETILRTNETAFNLTIKAIVPINNIDYKVLKIYSPYSVSFQLLYFYPFSEFYLNILIKSQSFSNYISDELKNIIHLNLANELIYIYIFMLIAIIVLKLVLNKFLHQINKPVNKLNDSKFITGQLNEEEEKLGKENGEEEETQIDEFKEFIQRLHEMVKGDIDLKQQLTQKDGDKMKLELENLNKEYEQIKIHNIMVNEEKIEEFIEEKCWTSEVIKRKIEEIQEDPFVNKSPIFGAMIKKIKKEKEEEGKRKSCLDFHQGGGKSNELNSENNDEAFGIMIEDEERLFSKESLLHKDNVLFQDFMCNIRKYVKNYDESYINSFISSTSKSPPRMQNKKKINFSIIGENEDSNIKNEIVDIIDYENLAEDK